MPSRDRAPRLRGAALLVVAAAVCATFAFAVAPDLLDRRPSYTARYTAAELRERPDLTEVLPAHVDATRALLEALGATASVTWQPTDAQVFAHERDGKDEQVVDGYPVLRWDPQSWKTAESIDLDDATIDELARTFRGVLEPRGFTVSTADRSTARNPHDVAFVASEPHGGTLQLFDTTSGGLHVIAMTGAHLYRGDTCDPDPLACFPTVEDPLTSS